MSGRPAVIRQRDLKQTLNAARKAGASQVKVKFGEVEVTIPLIDGDEVPTAPDSNNSFDKVMRKPGA
jgi:hypothetical protein